jgi:hypothetical protein
MGEWVEVGYKRWYYFDPTLFKEYEMDVKEPAPESLMETVKLLKQGFETNLAMLDLIKALADRVYRLEMEFLEYRVMHK